jgi:hypothetical protein
MGTDQENTRKEIQHMLDMVQQQIVTTTTQLELLTDQYARLYRMWEDTEQAETPNV